MNYFLRVASLMKIVAIEYVAMFCLGAGIIKVLILRHGAHGCSGLPISWTAAHWGYLIVGLLAAGWVIWRIVKPAVVLESWRPTLHIGSFIMTNPAIKTAYYEFPSTHPSYVLVEILAIAPWLFECAVVNDTLAYFGCAAFDNWAVPWAMAGVGLPFPVLRLVSWYVLRRQLDENARVKAWKPVGWVYCIVGPILMLWMYSVGADLVRKHQRPVVMEGTFAGGLSAHPEFLGKQVRLVGKRKLDQSYPCNCSKRSNPKCGDATLLDLGNGGDVLVMSMYSGELIKHARGTVGTPMPAVYGMLAPMPKGSPLGVTEEGALKEYRDFAQIQCGEATSAHMPSQGRAFLVIDESF